MYYLQSRYYNPEFSRFINCDKFGGLIGSLLSHNAFAYCMNNPVNMQDQSGYWSSWLPMLENYIKTVSAPVSTSTNKTNKVIPATPSFVGVGGTAVGTGEAVLNNFSKPVTGPKSSKLANVSFELKGVFYQPLKNAGKALGIVGNGLAIGSIILDVGNTWTSNNNNTIEKK